MNKCYHPHKNVIDGKLYIKINLTEKENQDFIHLVLKNEQVN
jgi:hypothetical protein